jgi:solute:Na+ symporter, SSS family
VQHGLILGAVLVTFCIALLALVSGWRVRSAAEFALAGRRANWTVVSGVIVGALVGGSSTVGTAQAAFVCGMPAWWFTLGAGIGCLVLATLFAVPLRRVHVETLPQFLACTFGNPIRPFVAVSDSIGIFLTIPAQAASAITLLTVLLHWPAAPVFLLVSLLVVAYVFTGGVISAGVAGFAKLLISFTALLVFGAAAATLGGGFGEKHDSCATLL